MPKKDVVTGRSVVRPFATEDGQVNLVHGVEVPGEDELGFKAGASWVLTPEVAQELVEALPTVIQEARAVVDHGGA